MATEISNTISRFFSAVDLCDWQAVQTMMTDSFHVDYSSYTGEKPADVSPAELTATWAGLLPYFDSVHHQIGNLVVEAQGNEASVQCHGVAYHYISGCEGGDMHLVIGTYDLKLIQADNAWKLSSIRFNFKFASGNLNVPDEAQRRSRNT